MSRMSELAIQIAEDLENGLDPLEIAERLGVPVEWVEGVQAMSE
jgi:hypothetical protein